MRSIEVEIFNDFKEGGFLNPLLEYVKNDSTLNLEFRGNTFDIYYRGGRILHFEVSKKKYSVTIDIGHFRNIKSQSLLASMEFIKNNKILNNESILNQMLEYIPFFKQVKDFHFSDSKDTTERDYQQLIIRENNYDRDSNSSDFFIIDMEYSDIGQIDLVGIEWRSDKRSSNDLKTYKPRLAFIEVKTGQKSIPGSSGLQSHINDIDEFVGSEKFESFKFDMLRLFEQKRELGLIANFSHNKNQITKFDSNEKPLFIALLSTYKEVNDKDEGSNILNILSHIKEPENTELRFSIANFMGYSLYSKSLFSVEQVKRFLEIKS